LVVLCRLHGRLATVDPGVGTHPSIDDDDASTDEVRRHRRHRAGELVGRAQVADRAEETDDGIEALAEIHRAHVGFDERDVAEIRACDGQHRTVEIRTGDLVELSQVPQVASGAARHVEERPRTGPSCLYEVVDDRRLRCVVLPLSLVDEVVDVRGRSEQRVLLVRSGCQT
jgi:hypothetical protein